jgi:hypothetical protein
MPRNTRHKNTKSEAEDLLDTALRQTFPASDAVAVSDPATSEPIRPPNRRPAPLDRQLVDELARNVEKKHAHAPLPGQRLFEIVAIAAVAVTLLVLAAEAAYEWFAL